MRCGPYNCGEAVLLVVGTTPCGCPVWAGQAPFGFAQGRLWGPAPTIAIPDPTPSSSTFVIEDPVSLFFLFLCLRSRAIPGQSPGHASWRFFAWPHCEPHEACPCPRAGMRPLQRRYDAAKSSPVIQGSCFSPGGWSIINIHMWMPQCKDSLMMHNRTGHTMPRTRRPKIISNSTPPPPPPEFSDLCPLSSAA